MNQKIKAEMISRRKALSLLGLGAALAITLSSALKPSEAEAQEATGTRPRPRPLRPPGPTECNGGKGGAPIAMSDAMAAMSDATSDERVRNQKRRRPPQRLHRNSGPSAVNAWRRYELFQRAMRWARPHAGKMGGSESPAFKRANIW